MVQDVCGRRKKKPLVAQILLFVLLSSLTAPLLFISESEGRLIFGPFFSQSRHTSQTAVSDTYHPRLLVSFHLLLLFSPRQPPADPNQAQGLFYCLAGERGTLACSLTQSQTQTGGQREMDCLVWPGFTSLTPNPQP